MGSAAYGAYKFETESHIVLFATLGPKNYAIVTLDGSHIIKVRGFNVRNPYARELINYETMAKMLLEWVNNKKVVVACDSFTMRLDRHRQTVSNKIVVKKYSNDNFDKRFLNPDRVGIVNLDTAPLGAKHGNYADL